MAEKTSKSPEIQDAEIILDHNNMPLGISIPTNLSNDGNYELNITAGNIDIIKDGEKISSINLNDDVPQEIYEALAEQDNIALIDDNATVMVTAKVNVDNAGISKVPSVLENEAIFPPEEDEDMEDNVDFTLFNKLMEENKEDEAEILLKKIMEEFRKKNKFTPPKNANDNILNNRTAEEFIAQAAIPQEPPKLGESIKGQAGAVASIGASGDESRVKGMAKAVGGFAVPVIATLAVKMTISTALTAALGPAVAAVAIPVLFAGYSGYKLANKAKEQEGGIGKRFFSAMKENKFQAGMLLGSLAVGIAARMGGLDPLADFIDNKIDAVMGASDAVEALPSEYADMNGSQLKEKAFELFNGRGGEEVDQAMALKLYEAAAEMGNVDAKVDLAYIQYHGLGGVEADPEAAVATMKELGRTEWLGGQDIPELNGNGTTHNHTVGGTQINHTDGPRLNDNNIAALYESWEDYPAYPEGSYTDMQFEQRLTEAMQNGTTDAKSGIVTINPTNNEMYYTHDIGDGRIVTHVIEMDEYKNADFLDDAPVGLYEGAIGFDQAELRNGVENMLDFAVEQGGNDQAGVVIGFVNPDGNTAGASMDVHAFRDADGNIQMRVITDDYFEQNRDWVKAAASQTVEIERMGNQIVFNENFEYNTENMVNRTGINLGPETPPPISVEDSYDDDYEDLGDGGDDNDIGWGTTDEDVEAEVREDSKVSWQNRPVWEDENAWIWEDDDPESSQAEETATADKENSKDSWQNRPVWEDENAWIWEDDEPKQQTTETKFATDDNSNNKSSRFTTYTDEMGRRVSISEEGEDIIRKTVENTIRDIKSGKITP